MSHYFHKRFLLALYNTSFKKQKLPPNKWTALKDTNSEWSNDNNISQIKDSILSGYRRQSSEKTT